MSGTVEGGKNAAKKNKAKYGADFYKLIGAKGGKRGRTGGFFKNRELARKAGALGGSISSRKGIKTGMTKEQKAELEKTKLLMEMERLKEKLRKIEDGE